MSMLDLTILGDPSERKQQLEDYITACVNQSSTISPPGLAKILLNYLRKPSIDATGFANLVKDVEEIEARLKKTTANTKYLHWLCRLLKKGMLNPFAARPIGDPRHHRIYYVANGIVASHLLDDRVLLYTWDGDEKSMPQLITGSEEKSSASDSKSTDRAPAMLPASINYSASTITNADAYSGDITNAYLNDSAYSIFYTEPHSTSVFYDASILLIPGEQKANENFAKLQQEQKVRAPLEELSALQLKFNFSAGAHEHAFDAAITRNPSFSNLNQCTNFNQTLSTYTANSCYIVNPARVIQFVKAYVTVLKSAVNAASSLSDAQKSAALAVLAYIEERVDEPEKTGCLSVGGYTRSEKLTAAFPYVAAITSNNYQAAIEQARITYPALTQGNLSRLAAVENLMHPAIRMGM